MRPPIRLAILECDTPLPKTAARYGGGYGAVFESLLKAGGTPVLGRPGSPSGAGSEPSPDSNASGSGGAVGLAVTKYQVELHPETYPNLQDVDAILVTGSRHDSFADTPWMKTLVDFTAQALLPQNRRVRIIGVCFGHQIVARALGVKVGRNPDGWEISVKRVNLSDKGREVFRKDFLDLYQMHRDIVFYLPPGVQTLGSSPICKIQGMYIPHRLLTVQGHPEFTVDIVTEILESRHVIDVFSDDVFHEAMERVRKPHDAVAVSRAFWRFLKGELEGEGNSEGEGIGRETEEGGAKV